LERRLRKRRGWEAEEWFLEVPSATGYNSWLREAANVQLDTLLKNMDKLPDQLSELQSVLLLEEISSARLARVSQAMIHMVEEIRLLVTLTEVNK